MSTIITVVPAYGRDYKTRKEVLADWEADKDFLVQNMTESGYINRSQAQQQLKPGDTINIRYKGLREILPIKIKASSR